MRMAATKKRAVTATSRSKAPSGNDAKPSEKRVNPFEQRSNHRSRQPALNRKVKGANRNVGQARSKAAEKRENDLLPEFKRRKLASEIVDKRFGEGKGGEQLSHEEKMLKRFQTVRSKKRAGRFHLGDDAGGLEDDDDEDDKNILTHGGKSLKEVLDEENVVEAESDDEEEDVDELIERLKSGETFNAVSSDPKKHMTKKEAMMDVIRKSKMLKMERQREKEEDEDERDRVDALMRDVVVSGGLTFRPTGEAKRVEESKDKSVDEYEKMVRELQLDRGPRAAASERTKTIEEIAAEELKELERMENERLKRIEGDASDQEDLSDEEEANGKRKRKQKKAIRESDDDEVSIDEGQLDLPYLIECPHSHMELLEFLAAHPGADLRVVIQRIRKSTSVHLKAENRNRLAKLVDVLLEHLSSVGERRAQLPSGKKEGNQSSLDADLVALVSHLYGIARDVPRETSTFMFNRLELARRTLENHLSRVHSLPASLHGGGDYGSATCEFSKSTIEKRLPGGHKDGLAESLNAEMTRLAQLRGDDEIATSSTRCWPSGGDFAFYVVLAGLYSTTDQRHPLVSSAALLLSRSLIECPLRGERDVVAAIQVAQLLEQMIRRNEHGANRFAPEVFLLLRVILRQLSLPVASNSEPSTDRLFRLDVANVQSKAAFNFLRSSSVAAKAPNPKKGSKVNSKEQTSEPVEACLEGALRGFFTYSNEARSAINIGAVRDVCLDAIVRLMEHCTKAVSIAPSADVFLGDLIHLVNSLDDPALKERFANVRKTMELTLQSALSSRKPLRLQEFTPEDVSIAPRFLVDSNTAKRPGEPERVLKRQIKRERKGVARELRLDGQFLAEVRQKEKSGQLQAARAKRQQNFRDLEGQQAQFNQMVRDGFAIKGAGVGGLKLRGRQMGKRVLGEE